MITLKTNRLRVEILEPGEGRNQTVRFDRAGFISRVTLDGKHEFCTVEPDNLSHPCSGGAGLCSEIKDDNIWDEVPVGKQCPKFGVGLLEKPSGESYKFFEKSYRKEFFQISWEASGSRAVFRTEPKPCMGRALRQTKAVTLDGNSINILYTFENTGEKRLNLREYVHNFVTIDMLPIGPDYYLSFPTARRQDGKHGHNGEGTICGKGSGFTFSGYDAAASMADVSGAEIDPAKPFSWKITNAISPAAISEEESFIPESVPIWTIDHIISPEVYHSFSIAPGETHTYTRKWVFSC